MKQEDKDLLLRYLTMALPYKVKILHNDWDYDRDCDFSSVETLIGIDDRFIYTLKGGGEKDEHSIIEPLSILDYKPYLRPMSSMTEEEKKEYRKTQITKWVKSVDCTNGGYYEHRDTLKTFDWLNAHHFDYRGLIDKGLAIAASEGMYNVNEK